MVVVKLTGVVQVFLACVLAACAFGAGAAEAPRPNVVLVMADDLGYGDVGFNGSSLIATPNLDRLAREGVNLSSFYSSANVCTPARAGLLTGRYPVRTGLARGVVFPPHPGGLLPEEVTIAEVLHDAGYRTGMIGKWHLGNQAPYWPTHAGFEYFYGVPYSNDMNPFPLYRGETVVEDEADQRTLTERYTREAVNFIERHREKRFFLYVAHTMPHIPLYVSDRFEGRSDAGLYGDVVETIDWGMGEILDAVKRFGLDEETIVIFTSDNGPWYEGSSGAYRDRKGSSWEGGMRVPFFARWPGVIDTGTRSDAISMNIDLLPTLAKLAGATLPDDRPIDGRDVFDVWRGNPDSPHEVLYLFNKGKIAAVRTPEWKFVVESYYKGHNPSFRFENHFNYPGLLFNMAENPREHYSMARENPDVVAKMDERYRQGVQELVEPHKDFDARKATPKNDR